MCAGIFRSKDLAFDTALAESRTDDHACHALELCGDILSCELFAVDKVSLDFMVVVCSGMSQRFEDTLVGILKVIFADQGDVNHFCSLVASFKERPPWAELRRFAYRHIHLAEDNGIKALCLHADRYFIDGRHIQALYDGVLVYITEVGHFFLQSGIQFVFRTQDEDVRLDTQALKLFDRSLCRLGLQFLGCCQIGHISQMEVDGILAEFPTQLADGFQERQ